MKHDVRLSHQLLALETEHKIHVLFSLEAPPSPTTAHPPVHLALALDRSGSMAGEKLHTTRACARMLVDRMRPVDQVALVTFNEQVELRVPMVPVDKKALIRAIDGIQPGGTTNLSGGWLKAVEECRRPKGEGLRRTLLLSDGLANAGIADPEKLVQMAGRAMALGISTSTIGFGGEFDERLMTGLAESGQGNAYFAASMESVPAIFEQEFEGLSAVVAQNISVELRPTDDVVVQRVLNAYRAVAVPGGLQVHLGDAWGSEERRVVFELLVPGVKALGERRIASIVLRYVGLGEEIVAREIKIPVLANHVPAKDADARPDTDVEEEIHLLMTAEAQRRAIELADQGRVDEAADLLAHACVRLKQAAPTARRSKELWEAAEMTAASAQTYRSRQMDALSSKEIHYMSHSTMYSLRTRYRLLEERLRRLEEGRRRREAEGRSGKDAGEGDGG